MITTEYVKDRSWLYGVLISAVCITLGLFAFGCGGGGGGSGGVPVIIDPVDPIDPIDQGSIILKYNVRGHWLFLVYPDLLPLDEKNRWSFRVEGDPTIVSESARFCEYEWQNINHEVIHTFRLYVDKEKDIQFSLYDNDGNRYFLFIRFSILRDPNWEFLPWFTAVVEEGIFSWYEGDWPNLDIDSGFSEVYQNPN